MMRSVLQNELPSVWKAVSYPSKKTLLSYVEDLASRIAMLEQWIESEKAPSVFWLSGFFFTHSLLTGVRQNFARKSKVPIDKVTFAFDVLKPEAVRELEAKGDFKPEDGCYIRGLFLEGAGWNEKHACLQEQAAKVLHVEMPIIHFISQNIHQPATNTYNSQSEISE